MSHEEHMFPQRGVKCRILDSFPIVNYFYGIHDYTICAGGVKYHNNILCVEALAVRARAYAPQPFPPYQIFDFHLFGRWMWNDDNSNILGG